MNKDKKEHNPATGQSDSSYSSLFNSASDSIYILNELGVFIDVNPAAVKMYGYAREEIVGNTPEMLSAPGRNDLKKTQSSIVKAFEGKPQRFEWWGKRKNGEVFPKDVSLNKGQYFGREVVFAMARDITERVNAIKALKESEDKYRSLTSQLPLGVYRTNIDGKLIYANLTLAKMLDYESVEELLQFNVNNLYSNPVDRQKQLSSSRKKSSMIQSEFELRKKTGGSVWVRDSSRLMFDSDGNPEYFDGILEDITEWKQAKKDLEESAANLRAIIENTLESIWSVNTRYEIQYVNEVFSSAFQNTFGVLLTLGSNIVESLPEFLRPVWKERYNRTFKNEHFVFEDKIEMGEICIYVEVAMNPIVVDGEVVGASMYGKDITKQKMVEAGLIKAKEKAEESDRLKSAFLANMSHEIRTPMNGILGFLELLREPDLSEENKNDYLNIVTKSGERLLDTINDIIEVSKIEAGEMQAHISPVNIPELMAYYHGFFRQMTDRKGLKFEVSNNLPSEFSAFGTDRNKLESIITNLLKNAIKFTCSGSIEFGNLSADGDVVFFVRDTGIGIHPERIDSIFGRFIQADQSNTRPHEGSGLGLSIVKAYIDMLGGKIWVESEIGKGSTFYFSLPSKFAK